MRSFILGLVATVAAIETVASNVHELTLTNFNEMVNDGSPWLIEYYAPWCGHCKALLPIFEETAAQLSLDNSKTRLGKVDCTAHTGICSHEGVRGYPTVKYHADGKTRLYNSKRTKDAILKFIYRMAEPAIIEAPSGDAALQLALEHSKSDFNPAVVLCSSSESAKTPVIENVANEIMDLITFVHYTSPDCTSRTGYKNSGITIVHRNKDVTISTFDKPLSTASIDDISKYIFAHAHAPVTKISHWNFSTLNNQPLPLVLVAVDNKDFYSIVTSKLKDLYDRGHKMNFAFSYIDSKELGDSMQMFGFNSDAPFPQVSVVVSKFKGYYPDTALGGLDNLETGLAKILSGEIEAVISDDKSFANSIKKVIQLVSSDTKLLVIVGIIAVLMVSCFVMCCMICFTSEAQQPLKTNTVTATAAAAKKDDETKESKESQSKEAEEKDENIRKRN